MTVPPLRPSLSSPGTRSGDPFQSALVVAITVLGTLMVTQDPSAVPMSVAPVLLALRLRS